MSLRALRTLHAIARHGSFARAGQVVGLTPSAVSLQVKSLEEEFDVQLFDRSRRLPTLTEAGKIVLAKSEEVLRLYDRIADSLSEEQSLAGRLRLGAIQTALSGILPPALVALNRQHPRLRVHVEAGMSAELASKVAAGELDAALTTEPVKPHPPDLNVTPICEDRFWLVAPRKFAGRSQRDLLSDLPFIRFDSRAWAGRLIDRELRRQRISVREEMVLDSQEVILRMVESELGAAVIPLADPAHERPSVICLPFGDPQLSRKIVLLEHQRNQGNAIAAALAQRLLEAAHARS